MAEERSGCLCDYGPKLCRFCQGDIERAKAERARSKAIMEYAFNSRKESFLEDLDDPEFCRKVMEKFGFMEHQLAVRKKLESERRQRNQ